ncbi:MAG TPA: TIGR00341 family protein [Chloroflexota bacterium]|nr:TIGR00341 family protein [Chloroflexota bacterium]
MSTLSNIIRENRFQPADVPKFADKLFYEGKRRRPYLERFFVLLFLSTIIATAGILGDSTATVIGAMIVAPLMTPIMATAASLIMGNMSRALQSLLLVTSGMIVVIFLSWLWGTIHPGVISFEGNSQIVGRVSPRLIDLIAALASGAAGAFCLSRDDIADSLPGVAIAISLVPPLCVVGISASAGEWDAAWGALLLFVTNFLSILLAGGGVLALLGLNQAAMIEVHGTARRNAFIAIAIAILLVAAPLTATGNKVAREARTEVLSRRAAMVWVAGTDYDVRQIRVLGDNVYIAVLGDGAQRPFDELVTAVQQSVGRPVIVTLETVPSQKAISSTTD